jgi:hypothetical protein
MNCQNHILEVQVLQTPHIQEPCQLLQQQEEEELGKKNCRLGDSLSKVYAPLCTLLHDEFSTRSCPVYGAELREHHSKQLQSLVFVFSRMVEPENCTATLHLEFEGEYTTKRRGAFQHSKEEFYSVHTKIRTLTKKQVSNLQRIESIKDSESSKIPMTIQ